MLIFRTLLICSLALAIGCSKETPQSAEKVEAIERKPQSPLTEDDFRILDVVLIDLLDFEDFIGSGRGNNATKIVLDTMTAGDFSGFYERQFKIEASGYDAQINAEELGQDMSRRNPKELISLVGYKSPSKKVLLADQGAIILSGGGCTKEDAYNLYRYQNTPIPNASRFVIAWLPGYSKDGNTAAFRAAFGPYLHGASLTYMLARKDGKWTVIWRFVARYT